MLTLRVWGSGDGLVAQAVENRLLRWIRQEKFLPPYLSASEMPKNGGWSEAFSDEGVIVLPVNYWAPNGATCQNRTGDLLFTRELLYRLS